jgi:hypothetical protein
MPNPSTFDWISCCSGGNEGPLEGYIDATGLMFENAASFGALIMFAEV